MDHRSGVQRRPRSGEGVHRRETRIRYISRLDNEDLGQKSGSRRLNIMVLEMNP